MTPCLWETNYTSKGTVVSDNHFIFFEENNPFIKKLNLEESEALEGDLKPDEMLVALKNTFHIPFGFRSHNNSPNFILP
jgi:hypothetical protein